MAQRKTKRQLADEAWHRAQEKLALVEEPQRPANYLRLAAVPASCPQCGNAKKWQWSTMFGDLLQCNSCAQLIEVPRAAFIGYLEALHAYYAMLNAPKPKATGKRTRGAR